MQTLGRKYIEKEKKLKPLSVLTTAAVLSSTFALEVMQRMLIRHHLYQLMSI
ncbi:hypothetical protein AAHB49_05495 [Bacillus cereus]